MAIRTPDQRVRVFVSSTLQELAEERRAVRESIVSLRLTPVMFEEGARPHPPRALYRAYLEQSDVFIGLYWEHYGWVAPGEEVSGLEDEYGLAGDRPKLIYIKAPAPNREPRLTELLARIRSDARVSYRPFTDAGELRSLVADDLAVLLTERFAARTPGEATTSWPALPALPRAATRLIGREADIARVAELLSDPDARLVTISGPGGIGKTRLALAVAERAKDRYAGGVAYVDLAAVGEPSLLIPTIAGALGIQEGPGLNVAAQLRERLTDAQMLIVLDWSPGFGAPRPRRGGRRPPPPPPSAAPCSYTCSPRMSRMRPAGRLHRRRDGDRPRRRALPRARPGHPPRLPADRQGPRRDRRDLPPPRRAAAGDRAGERPPADPFAVGDARAHGLPPSRLPARRRARSAASPADAARHRRVEPFPPRSRFAAPIREAGRLCRERRYHGDRRGGEPGRKPGDARPARRPCRPEPGACRGRGGRAAVRDARDDPRVCGRASRGERRGACVPSAARGLLSRAG